MKSITAIVLCVLISVATAIETGKLVKVNQDRSFKRRPFKIIPRIVNGNVAPPTHYPYHVSIITGDPGESSKNGNGAILNENWIITVADFIQDENKIRVNIGSNEYYKPLFTVYPDAYVTHPHYNPDDNYKNNIALLHLPDSESLRFPNANYAPIRLPARHQEHEKFIDYEAQFSGFGSADPFNTVPSEYLRFVSAEIIENFSCVSYYHNNYELINSNIICAKTFDPKQGACAGDGGAPLVINEYGTSTLVGLLSVLHYNGDCGRKPVPAAFTRITGHFDWIEANTNYQFRP